MFLNNAEVPTGTGLDTAINDFLPKFEYINTKQYYDSVAKFTKTAPIGIMLSGVLSTILENNPQYAEFQDNFKKLFEDDTSAIKTQFDTVGNEVKVCLEKQFPDCNKVKFEVSLPIFEDLLKNFDTSINDGVETSAGEKGDGMQRALMLAIIQVYANHRKNNEEQGKSFLFFVDEAELHLHPTAQRKLKDVLYAISCNNDQVFINTHSSVFISDDYTDQTIFQVAKLTGETEIEKVTPEQKPYVVFELLGGSPQDLLLPRNFLIVEGLSEVDLFKTLIARFYPDRPSLQIIPANGDFSQMERSINSIEKLYKPLSVGIYKNKMVILIDKPSVERYQGYMDFITAYAHLDLNNQFFNLPVTDIEQYYPSQQDQIYLNWKRTEEEAGNMSGKQKRKLAQRVGSCISKEQFESEMTACFDALKRCWELAY